jgi:hypothetical protein
LPGKGQVRGGLLHTIDINDEWCSQHLKWPMSDKIILRHSDTIIQRLPISLTGFYRWQQGAKNGVL